MPASGQYIQLAPGNIPKAALMRRFGRMADIVSTGRANPGPPDGAKITILATGDRCPYVEFREYDLAMAE